jgi:gliding motility-associated lipoprotein GldH
MVNFFVAVNKNRAWWIFASILLAMACQPMALYEKLYNVKKAQWLQTDIPEFTFDIKDTTQLYKVYVVVRHTNRYAYRNIWLQVGVQYPADSLKLQQFELPLAGTDKWLGVGMDDIFERRVLLFPQAVRFTQPGVIRFTLQHTMRLNPLPEVMQVGIRVEPQTTNTP